MLYTISGKRLPVVFHIGSRALTSQSLNIHADHDDVMGCEDVGWGMLFTRNVQGAGDLALIARRTAEETSTPFFNIQDGFLTTHTVENVLLPEVELMKDFVGRPENRLTNFFDPYNPVMTGVVHNQDSYMKGKIAREEAPKADLEVRMQGIVLLGIFLKATPFDEEAGLSYDEVMTGVDRP